jgi:hypothetical protein
MSNQETSEKFETVCKEIINRLVTQDIERDDLEELKKFFLEFLQSTKMN